MPVSAVMRGLHGGGGEGSRRSPWRLARHGQVVSLQAVRGTRVRSRPTLVDPLHGTQGFRRHLVVVRRALRVSGALRAAAEAGGRCRREERNRHHRQPATEAPASCQSRLPSPEPNAQISDTAEREIIVDTATSQVVLTNRGGRILHWRLKDYRTRRRHGRSRAVWRSSGSAEAIYADRRGRALTRRLNSALYRVTWRCRRPR